MIDDLDLLDDDISDIHSRTVSVGPSSKLKLHSWVVPNIYFQ